MTDQDLRPPSQRARTQDHGHGGTGRWLWLALGIAALGYGGWTAREYWAERDRAKESVPAAPTSAPVQAPSEVPSLAPEPAAQAPVFILPDNVPEVPQHPVPAPAEEAAVMAPQDAATLDQLVVQWLGQRALQFVVTPNVARHVVATIDNLPRGHAAPQLWPLNPVGGRMVVADEGTPQMHIAPANAQRYDAVVDFVTSLDPAQVVQWYRQAYPLLQQTYEDLGYPGKYFNDRLVAVLDHLLQTPQPAEPLALRIVQVQSEQGMSAPQQPWLRYEYERTDLEALSAGQKILVRMGAAHRQRVLDYLQAVRAQVAQTGVPSAVNPASSSMP